MRLCPPNKTLLIKTDSQNCSDLFSDMISTNPKLKNKQDRAVSHTAWEEVRCLLRNYQKNIAKHLKWIKGYAEIVWKRIC